MAIYCCEAVDPEEEFLPVIPDQWPPELPSPASEASAVPIPQLHTPGAVSPGSEPAAGGGSMAPGGALASEPKAGAGGCMHVDMITEGHAHLALAFCTAAAASLDLRAPQTYNSTPQP